MSAFLDKFRHMFSRMSSCTSGGCDTCGWGGDPKMSEYDYDNMLIEMDEWITANFKKDEL